MTRRPGVNFFSVRSIVSLIGIDYTILKRSGDNNILKFLLSGFLVITIMATSFISVFYAFELMFHMWYAELLLSSFFSLMFFNIYIFLIQTFSKEVFPVAYKIRFFNLSNLSRLGFVLLIGYLIAQPIKIFIVRNQLDLDISVYKETLYNNFCQVNEALYSKDLTDLNNQRSYYSRLQKNETVDKQIAGIDNRLINIRQNILLANEYANQKIQRSDFFIKRIELAARYPITTLVMLTVVVVFFAPVALIYSISGNSEYYKLKKNSDKKLVVNDYNRFKDYYRRSMRSKYGLNINFYEHYVDPPFNTERHPAPVYLDQESFFDNLLEE